MYLTLEFKIDKIQDDKSIHAKPVQENCIIRMELFKGQGLMKLSLLESYRGKTFILTLLD
jgi:hypothetical protein